jgi:hypothetical protein
METHSDRRSSWIEDGSLSVNPEYKQARWAEVLDGQRTWERNKLCAGDDDKFRTEYVDPLKALSAEGAVRNQDDHDD